MSLTVILGLLLFVHSRHSRRLLPVSQPQLATFFLDCIALRTTDNRQPTTDLRPPRAAAAPIKQEEQQPRPFYIIAYHLDAVVIRAPRRPFRFLASAFESLKPRHPSIHPWVPDHMQTVDQQQATSRTQSVALVAPPAI
ncbi:hypothetical protein BKA81DRAFT_350306 [Phyllosticta paracitricarpa]|uniref:Secreted protein n=1 Tax=Phyllosticta citricarpa TaxID=55181 RepID=A0ABR1MFU6_9PEZI